MSAKKTIIPEDNFSKQSHKHKIRYIQYRILIVCEGEKTEPNYFNKFRNKYKGAVVEIITKGIGRGTKQVVEKAIDLKNKNNYDSVWA